MLHKSAILVVLVIGFFWLTEGSPIPDGDGGVVRGEFHYDKKIVSLQQEKPNSNTEQLSKRKLHKHYNSVIY